VHIIWSVAVQTLFYATPVLYVLDQLDQQYRWIILLNPLTPIFLAAREWIIDPSAPGPVDSAGGVPHLVGSLVAFVAVCVVSIWVFAREAPRMAEEL
jgi:lipopolysaccharide transport system permease protein